MWKGLACVRKWPVYPKSHQAPASIATAETFGATLKAFSSIGATPLGAYTVDAEDQTRTPRDIYMAAKYGNLHEATMTDFLALATEIRDSLAALEALLLALDSIDSDQIVVNVDESVLPTGAATQATLATLATEAKLELVRLLLASLDGKEFATQTTLAALLTELALKANLTETQPISATALPLPTGAATEAKQNDIISALPPPPDTPTIYNVALTDADTEYSQALPANTRKFLIKCRASYPIQLAFTNGASETTFLTIPANMTYYEDLIALPAVTLYFRCLTAAQVAEIVAWTQA
ncbi:hypothetical protein ES708_22251 [subsurface metagenome]